MSAMLTEALRLRSLGLSVIPLHAPDMPLPQGREPDSAGKVPLIAWKEFQTRLPAEEEIREWWNKWPHANVGIITGAISGVIVVDVDGPEGQQTLRRLNPIPVTWRSVTGRGEHLWFKHPGFDVQNFAKKAPGLDFRGDRGYVVAPGSRHRNGVEYRWVIPPDQTALAEPPAWLRELIGQPAERHDGASASDASWRLQKLQGVPEGQRHDAFTRQAGYYAHIGLAPEESLGLLLPAATRCIPPFPSEEVRQIVKDITEKERQKRAARGDGRGGASMTTEVLPKLPQAQVLTAIADFAEVFHAPDGDTAYATVEVNGHHETWPVRSRGFRLWLVRKFFEIERKPPSAQALADALGLIEARARFDGKAWVVSVRVAAANDAIYLDLANDAWEAVKITAAGWDVVTDPPVKFRRTRGMLALPRPRSGGAMSDLRPFVNVKNDADWALFSGWLVMAARPTGPYPVLILHGPQGAAKSSVARVARDLIDPNATPLRSEPRDLRDLAISAFNGWIIPLDNLSSVQPWLSDAICRLASGGGFSTRELYTDTDETIINVQRPVILNGIEEVETRADLLDRALILYLPEIDDEQRRAEVEFWEAFQAARPRLLGALLDAVSAALKNAPNVRLEKLPRMADFALFAVAAEPALGVQPGTFIGAYVGNRQAVHDLALDASPVAGPLRELVGVGGDWTGTATDLFAKLNSFADEATRKLKSWPAGPRALAGELRRVSSSLRAIGVEVTFLPFHDPKTRRRLISLKENSAFHASDPSDPSFPQPRTPRSGPEAKDAKDEMPIFSTSEGSAQIWPADPCHACHGCLWWRSVYGVVACRVCHPPADPALVAAEVRP